MYHTEYFVQEVQDLREKIKTLCDIETCNALQTKVAFLDWSLRRAKTASRDYAIFTYRWYVLVY